MKYVVKLKPNIKKQLKKLDKKQVERILVKTYALAYDPYPIGHSKLVNLQAYRIRVGDYRVIYEVNDNILLVFVVRVGHRRDVYK